MQRPVLKPGCSAGVLAVLLLMLATQACVSSDDSVPGTESRRHVLLITVDTLRADHVGAASHGSGFAPFLDAALRDGFDFSRATTPIPRTTPALASLLTGSYPHTHGIRELFGTLDPNVRTLGEVLRANGFATVAVVTNLVLDKARGLDRGFDVYDFRWDSWTAVPTTNRAIRRVEALESKERIFLWVHYIDPHIPYIPPAAVATKIDPDYEGPYKLNFGPRRGVGGGNGSYPKDLGKIRAVFRNDLPPEVNAHIRKLYAAEVRHTDRQIARLVQWLRRNVGNDWLFLFSADHGESLGEHDYYYDHGDYVYDATLRVPLGIVFPPGDPLRGSKVVETRVSLIDLLPTVADLVGVPLSPELHKQVEGRSLVPLLRGGKFPARTLFAECGRSYEPEYVHNRVSFDVAGRFRAAMSDDWKLIWTPGQKAGLVYQLYDVRTDPREEKSRYDPLNPVAPALARQVRDWARTKSRPLTELDDAEREALRALGYLQ